MEYQCSYKNAFGDRGYNFFGLKITQLLDLTGSVN
jgi:hypothetical protein